jgi:hypothetical protein
MTTTGNSGLILFLMLVRWVQDLLFNNKCKSLKLDNNRLKCFDNIDATGEEWDTVEVVERGKFRMGLDITWFPQSTLQEDVQWE